MKHMKWPSKPSAIWLILAGSLVLILGYLVLRPSPAAPLGASLPVARNRWTSRPFDSYQLVIQEDTKGGSCGQAVEVEEERVRAVLWNNCQHSANWTITNLFNWITQNEIPSAECYPSPGRCACEPIVVTRADYNAQLGYPRTIFYSWTLRRRLESPDYWKYVWWTKDVPDCGYRELGGPVTITVVSLTPLP
jgi:hypothetical protein